MEPIRALIVEDNQFMGVVMNDMLKQHPLGISVLGIAQTGKEALELIHKLQPDVVFMDIELPDMTGFELLKRLESINFKTIFTTAHSNYAIKAFRFNALDYLVKPIKTEELNEAIARFKESHSNSAEVKNALVNLETPTLENQKFMLTTQKGTLRLALKHIVRLEGERNYSYLNLDNGTKELSSKNLAYFEDVLGEKGFMRCHRSHLVNRYHVSSIKDDLLILKNGEEIPVSRRKKAEVSEWFYNS